MIVHVLTVSIFLLSLLAFLSSFYFDMYFVYASHILETFCNRLTQVMICYIFWNMDNIKFVPVPTPKQTADEEVAQEDAIKVELVQSTDSDFA